MWGGGGGRGKALCGVKEAIFRPGICRKQQGHTQFPSILVVSEERKRERERERESVGVTPLSNLGPPILTQSNKDQGLIMGP